MPDQPVPQRVTPLGRDERTTPWDEARDRLANAGPEDYSHGWLATVHPDGRPHLMPIISFWMDGALHFIAGEGTRKGRNLAANPNGVIGTENRRLPSLDIVIEGRAAPLDDPAEVRRIAEQFVTNNWPPEARGAEVHGPHATVAGPPPYRIYRLTPSRAFGLPSNFGMFEFDPDDLPKPACWDFAAD